MISRQSAEPRTVSTRFVCGLQLLSVFVVNEKDPYVADHKGIPQADFYRLLGEGLLHRERKVIQASARVCGMILAYLRRRADPAYPHVCALFKEKVISFFPIKVAVSMD
jgi:hypothetical protein